MMKRGDRVKLISMKEIEKEWNKNKMNEGLFPKVELGEIGTVTSSEINGVWNVSFSHVTILCNDAMVKILGDDDERKS